MLGSASTAERNTHTRAAYSGLTHTKRTRLERIVGSWRRSRRHFQQRVIYNCRHERVTRPPRLNVIAVARPSKKWVCRGYALAVADGVIVNKVATRNEAKIGSQLVSFTHTARSFVLSVCRARTVPVDRALSVRIEAIRPQPKRHIHGYILPFCFWPCSPSERASPTRKRSRLLPPPALVIHFNNPLFIQSIR